MYICIVIVILANVSRSLIYVTVAIIYLMIFESQVRMCLPRLMQLTHLMADRRFR